MKRRWLAIPAALAAVALVLTGASYVIYGRSPQATVYEWQLRRRFATDRTAQEEVERLNRRREKRESDGGWPEDVTFRTSAREREFGGMKVFALNWEMGDAIAVYLHGGAYINGFNAYQWRFMDALAAEGHCRVIAPAYHLAPWGDCARAYRDLTALWAVLTEANPEAHIVLMGDSAGGGLALGLAQQLRQDGSRLPDRLILLSPWVDVSMDNPDIQGYIDAEPILHLDLVKVHGKFWAGELDVHDWHASPLYGGMAGLPPVTIYCGTREMLCPDILLAAEKLAAAGTEVDLKLGRGLNHDYPLMPIPEGRAAAREILSQFARLEGNRIGT